MTALMYHDVVAAGAEDSSGFPGRDAALYKVTPEMFASHLDAIALARPNRPLSTRPAVPALPAYPPHLPHATYPTHAPRDHLRRWRGERDGGGGRSRAAWVHRAFLRSRRTTSGRADSSPTRPPRAGAARPRDRQPFLLASAAHGTLRLDAARRTSGCGAATMLTDILGADVCVASVPGGDFAPQVARGRGGQPASHGCSRPSRPSSRGRPSASRSSGASPSSDGPPPRPPLRWPPATGCPARDRRSSGTRRR